MWAQGYDGGHGPSRGQAQPWEGEAECTKVRQPNQLRGEGAEGDDAEAQEVSLLWAPGVWQTTLRGEGAEGDDAEAQEVSLLWAPGVWQTTLRVFGPPMQGDDAHAEELYFLWGPGV